MRRKAQGIPKEVAGPTEKQEQEELRKEPPSKGTMPTGRPRPSDNTPDPSRGPVGIDPPETHTFLQTILLPEPIRKGKKAKGRPRPEKVKQPVRKARKPKEPRKPSTDPSLKKEKPDHPPQPDENGQETNIGGPAAHEAKLLQRREYDRIKNKSPERREYQRQLAQEQRQRAKELGRCRNCSKPAILGQTRCPTCAENHRQSRRRSDANRRAAAEETAPTGQADQ